jgi:Mn-dependent DtxR family transcriptional regulator
MMDDRSLWQLMRNTWVKIEPCYLPAIDPLVKKSGLGKREWGILLIARTLEPEDTTAGHLMIRGPYTASEQYLAWLSNAARQGHLVMVGEGRFRLTPFGREAVEKFIQLAREAMVEADPLVPEESQRLVEYLGRLVDSCLNTPPPPQPWAIGLSHALMPEPQPALPYIEQAFSCLGAYRDDAHLASWQSSGFSATAFETLTLIWRESLETLDDIAEKLKHRGHSKEVYANALAELRKRGYITGIRNALKLTSEGQTFRQHVESMTDRYFFTPWRCLNQADKNEMAGILTKLGEGLR